MKQIKHHHPRCCGTVEDYRGLAFDIRDPALRKSGLLDLPAGYIWHNAIAWPWIKQIRTVWGDAIELTLQNGHTERAALVSVACGFAGSLLREIPGDAENPPQAWRLRSALGGHAPAKATLHVEAHLCPPLCGAGPN